MPSRFPAKAWFAVLSLLLLALLGLWLFVHGGPIVLPRLDSATSAASPDGRMTEEDTSLDEPADLEPSSRIAAVRDQPGRKKNRRFSGRVVDAKGLPCESARVLLYSQSWGMTVDFTHTGSDGKFQLRYPYDGEFDLLARCAGVGTCDATKIELAVARERERVELVLNRPDWLEGKLTDGEDRSLGGVELWAFPAAFATADSSWLFRWRMRAECRTLRGECSGTTKTDEHGRFRFVDLEPGSYFIARRDRLDPPHDWRVPHNTGESEIELTEEHVWLTIRCPGAPGVSVFCAPVTREGPSDYFLDPSPDPNASPGWTSFDVEPCRVYRCGFIDPVLGLVEEELSMPCRGGTIAHELQLPQRPSPGRLSLTLSTPWRPYDERLLRVRIRSAASGVLLMSWTQSERGSADLPAGEFLLDVVDPPARGPEASARTGTMGEALITRRRITVQPAGETRVDLDV